ncbi:hypothetical protein [Phenylobacterium soli]|uniref:Uncharacterized protein n=1 Tax=Phenylobacterium soli TaxID=2170551 RepID=A0A328AME3_9CAUL|nr:hypothetical protein [Phenylobacterium soli]RAK54058.1 hypothetical protein DJ017_05730 [Phenylobacterium soli]
MSDAAFENRVSGIFSRLDQRLGGRLASEKAKAETLQAQDMRRVAFILTEAIEAEVKPAVKDALLSYDEAINRPLTPNERWEHALLKKIEQAVDRAIQQALALDKLDHPWKPLLSAEAPKLRARLLADAEAHFTALGKVGKRRRRSDLGLPEWLLWVAFFVGGLGSGLMLARLLGG